MSEPPPSSPPGSAPLQFAVSDHITTWDPILRRLEIGTRTVWVAPGVSVDRLAAGIRVTLTGHVEHPNTPDARWIVTQLTRD